MWNATRLSESTQRSQSAKLTKDFERFQEPIGRSCQAKASNSEGRPGNSDWLSVWWTSGPAYRCTIGAGPSTVTFQNWWPHGLRFFATWPT